MPAPPTTSAAPSGQAKPQQAGTTAAPQPPQAPPRPRPGQIIPGSPLGAAMGGMQAPQAQPLAQGPAPHFAQANTQAQDVFGSSPWAHGAEGPAPAIMKHEDVNKGMSPHLQQKMQVEANQSPLGKMMARNDPATIAKEQHKEAQAAAHKKKAAAKKKAAGGTTGTGGSGGSHQNAPGKTQ